MVSAFVGGNPESMGSGGRGLKAAGSAVESVRSVVGRGASEAAAAVGFGPLTAALDGFRTVSMAAVVSVATQCRASGQVAVAAAHDTQVVSS